ncbi:MAG: hypothetical protein AB1556_00975 [Bacillota bacterium]
MADKRHAIFTALEKTGQSVEEALVAWVGAAAALDLLYWETLEEAFGARTAHRIYSKVWEKLALGNLDHVLDALGVRDNINIKTIGQISKVYWESINCPYTVVEETDDIHVGEITICPYWESLKEIFGEERARDCCKKGMGATTANYYQAIIKALGKWDEIYATQDKCMCLGDDVCRVVFKKRKNSCEEVPTNF